MFIHIQFLIDFLNLFEFSHYTNGTLNKMEFGKLLWDWWVMGEGFDRLITIVITALLSLFSWSGCVSDMLLTVAPVIRTKSPCIRFKIRNMHIVSHQIFPRTTISTYTSKEEYLKMVLGIPHVARKSDAETELCEKTNWNSPNS